MTGKQEDREVAWAKLFAAARECRDLLLEDNGNTREVDIKDPWLGYMIGRMDDIIGHWDPDASPEEVQHDDNAAPGIPGPRAKK